MSDSVSEAARLEHEAEQLVGRARQMRARLTKACEHPLASLEFRPAASSTHTAAYDEYGYYVACKKCDNGHVTEIRVKHHKDD